MRQSEPNSDCVLYELSLSQKPCENDYEDLHHEYYSHQNVNGRCVPFLILVEWENTQQSNGLDDHSDASEKQSCFEHGLGICLEILFIESGILYGESKFSYLTHDLNYRVEAESIEIVRANYVFLLNS
jgi:hypothetical protein